jgi:riboflavin synthase
MFSWIIETTSRILSIDGGNFVIENHFTDEPLTIGQSIAHDGVCMTLTEISDWSYTFFAMIESFSRTNFGNKRIGDQFNVERCIRADTRIDGHFVTGHVDTIATVGEVIQNSDGSYTVRVDFDWQYRNLIVDKWSIAINGVSLTIVKAGDDYLTVSIIPHTWDVTNIGSLSEGSVVNLEFDILGKYIQRMNAK